MLVGLAHPPQCSHSVCNVRTMPEGDTPMRFVFVGDDGTFREVQAAADADTLATLQTLVDGYIELVGTTVTCGAGRRPVDIWLNEEGKMRSDFHANPHAQKMLDYSMSDVFVGPTVLSAADDDDETVGLDDQLIEVVKGKLLRMGATELPPASVEDAAEQQSGSREARVELGHEGHGIEPYARFVPMPDEGDFVAPTSLVVETTECRWTVRSTGLPCYLDSNHEGHCRSR